MGILLNILLDVGVDLGKGGWEGRLHIVTWSVRRKKGDEDCGGCGRQGFRSFLSSPPDLTEPVRSKETEMDSFS